MYLLVYFVWLHLRFLKRLNAQARWREALGSGQTVQVLTKWWFMILMAQWHLDMLQVYQTPSIPQSTGQRFRMSTNVTVWDAILLKAWPPPTDMFSASEEPSYIRLPARTKCRWDVSAIKKNLAQALQAGLAGVVDLMMFCEIVPDCT